MEELGAGELVGGGGKIRQPFGVKMNRAPVNEYI
jgi:hypothetical protein